MMIASGCLDINTSQALSITVINMEEELLVDSIFSGKVVSLNASSKGSYTARFTLPFVFCIYFKHNSILITQSIMITNFRSAN